MAQATNHDDKTLCYGKFPDNPKKSDSVCPCRAECELGAACLNRSRESAQDIHYQCQHVSVPHMIYDPNEQQEGEADSAAQAYFEHESESETFPAEGSGDLNLDGLVIPADQRPLFCDIVRKLAEFHKYTPKALDMLFAATLENKSQSAYARDRHITRAAVNKWLLSELKIAQKRNDIQARRDRELKRAKQEYADKIAELREKDNMLRTLSDRDVLIYKFKFLDGHSHSDIARKLNISRRTSIRVSLRLRSKLDKFVTTPLPEAKKI